MADTPKIGTRRVTIQEVVECGRCDDDGLVEDENWWPEFPARFARGEYERSEGDGLIVCGFCDGDRWRWQTIAEFEKAPS